MNNIARAGPLLRAVDIYVDPTVQRKSNQSNA